MRFSLAGNAGERGYQAQIERAVEAEELGYDGIFFSESLMSGLDPFQVLTAAALRTRRIKLGTAIMTMTFREPLVLANQAATLNEISQGRAILGLGTGDGQHAARTFFQSRSCPDCGPGMLGDVALPIGVEIRFIRFRACDIGLT